MTGEQFLHFIMFFLTSANTCMLGWLTIFIFQGDDDDKEGGE